ncbi:MAG: nickel-dependent lactate racemase [Candidatus Aminicenantales bacterium]
MSRQNLRTKEVLLDLGHTRLSVRVPEDADVLKMARAEPVRHPAQEVRRALLHPISTRPLSEIVRIKRLAKPSTRAVIVISDNTRPVPYTEEPGILIPIIEQLIKAGLQPAQICLLVATGTHRPMTEPELRKMLDPRVFALNIPILQHDCRDAGMMVPVKIQETGASVSVNRVYVESDIKILTGLVESHFMAGASGGRKSVCPGLVAEGSTYALHSGPILNSPYATDLILEGNPVHEASLQTARATGCDFIVNATLNSDFCLTGVFAGELDEAHRKAVEKLKTYAAIPARKTYDMVITHTGYVGVNHYQAAKGALVSVPVLREGGVCILAAVHPDKDPIGGANYRQMIRLLTRLGSDRFLEKILDPSWEFVPEQWEAQMWTRLFRKTRPENLIYATLDIPPEDFDGLPAKDARDLIPDAEDLPGLANGAVRWGLETLEKRLGRAPKIAVLQDGPYGIPLPEK